MHLGTYYNGVELHRDEKIIYAHFLSPHRVISTCSAAGGLREDLDYLYNHQSCEPAGHQRAMHRLVSSDPKFYRKLICGQYSLPDERCATLGTAANMRNAAIQEANFWGLTVVAVCTGGVETNAGRAGDPATVYEWNGAYERVAEKEASMHGTINTMLFVNQELTVGAMVRAVMTATEAKTAALQELVVGSRYSKGLATGTGTDQIGIAAQLKTDTVLSSAGKHCVLGELIGRTVHDAIQETLKLQNGLTPESQRSVMRYVERLGIARESLIQGVTNHLSLEQATLLCKNFIVIERDPLVVAAVAALVHVNDNITWGILPAGCIPELLAAYGAQVAAAISGDYARISEYRIALAIEAYLAAGERFGQLLGHAIALGFVEKWKDPNMDEVLSPALRSHGR
jgi:adenosylcobinamide amidohydrolase